MHHDHRSGSAPLSASSPVCSERSALTTRLTRVLAGFVAALLLTAWLLPEDADARKKRRERAEPPLRIVSIALTPETYTAGKGALEFTIDVKLPPGVTGAVVLEVSSLISSHSKRHMRFLWNRQPIDLFLQPSSGESDARSGEGSSGTSDPPSASPAPTSAPESRPPARRDQVSVTLSWDGTDQNREVVPGGRYDYIIRAKLLTPEGEKLRTHMVSWKKKGSIRITPPETALEEPGSSGFPEGDAAPGDEPEAEDESAETQDAAAMTVPEADATPSLPPQAN